MKINMDCESYKPTNKSGQKEACKCARKHKKFKREMHFYNAFMKNLDRKKNG